MQLGTVEGFTGSGGSGFKRFRGVRVLEFRV